jgi:hypothetical protein
MQTFLISYFEGETLLSIIDPLAFYVKVYLPTILDIFYLCVNFFLRLCIFGRFRRRSEHSITLYQVANIETIGCSFKFILKVSVEESSVNTPRITHQLFKSNLTFCVVCVVTV